MDNITSPEVYFLFSSCNSQIFVVCFRSKHDEIVMQKITPFCSTFRVEMNLLPKTLLQILNVEDSPDILWLLEYLLNITLLFDVCF